MLFVAFIGVLNYGLAHQKDKMHLDDSDDSTRKYGESGPSKGLTLGSNLRKRTRADAADTVYRFTIPRSSAPPSPYSSGSV